MLTRLVPATNIKLGRNIFISPDNSSMRLVSYGRIRLSGNQKDVAFANESQETGLICLKGECKVSGRRSIV
jgi:5-deoxy-glucuronate isomerase